MRSRRRLALENLEGRALLTAMYVNSLWTDQLNDATVEIGDSGDTATIGTDAFATIKAAITKAGAGDEIRIAPGTYSETFSLANKPGLSLIGAGVDQVFIDVAAGTTNYGINIPASAPNVTLSGFRVVGDTASAAKVDYGINAAGVSGLEISDVRVDATKKSGINLNGATNFSIENTTVLNTTGAGIFMTDVKDGTLSNITTSGNAWTGVGFSTFGKSFEIGVERIVVSGNNSFGESTTPNGGVMFEESRWDATLNDGAGGFDMDNPLPITFSTDLTDGKDVTFLFGDAGPSLNYVLTGAQDDTWTVRHNFYGTLGEGLAAALSELPEHYTGVGVTLSPLGAGVGAPSISGETETDRGSTYTLMLTAAENVGVDTQWRIEWGDGAVSTVPSSDASATYDYPNAPGDYVIKVTEIVAGVYTSASSEHLITVHNVDPTIAITGVPGDPVGRNAEVELGSEAGGPDIDILTYAWSVTRDGEDFPVAPNDEAGFAFTPDLPGVYIVTLTATGRFDSSTTTTASITVSNANPVAVITGAPVGSIEPNQVVDLSAETSNDPESDALTYGWVVTRDGDAIDSGSGANFTFTPTEIGAYVITLTVIDAHGGEGEVALTINVVEEAPTDPGTDPTDPGTDPTDPGTDPTDPGTDPTDPGTDPTDPGTDPTDPGTPTEPVPPVVEFAPLPGLVMAGDIVNLAATATDANPSTPLTYAWTITRDGVFMGAGDQASLQYIPLFSGVYEATLVVSDGDGGTTTRSIQFQVQTNVPPAAEQAVQVFQQRFDAQIQRQAARVNALAERFGEQQPLILQRMAARVAHMQVRLQSLLARRVAVLQRLFSRRGFR